MGHELAGQVKHLHYPHHFFQTLCASFGFIYILPDFGKINTESIME